CIITQCVVNMYLVLIICLTASVVAQDEFLYKPRLRNVECGANEVYECIYSCPPQPICNTRYENVTCSTVEENCSHWCICVADSCGLHEYYACGPPCDTMCPTLYNGTDCNYTECMTSCYCENGYARSDSGRCVLFEHCPRPFCSEFEVATNCKRVCLNETCAGIDGPNTCIEGPCAPGCDCKPGFYREDERGPCIPMCECPEKRNSDECLNPTGEF
ncbi:hypothetical protein SFRURICE_009213, partial [Spodoptera frugiperda]